ncbi:hypothetical protein MKW94_012327 [Papaver nudicaule]|uniref:Uncharacterized protein n=1 Tax=Papaver nudicaule TaxID=74823 RepID=A0AA41VWN0_PAPNU|nr:hypothetical protein [Papaver nudicaule]
MPSIKRMEFCYEISIVGCVALSWNCNNLELGIESLKCRCGNVFISGEEAVYNFPSFNFTNRNG